MPGILDQLFGMQQPQQPQGLVPSILSARFQPSPDDASLATLQTATTGGKFVTPYDAMNQRIGASSAGEDLLSKQMSNQMTQFQMPYIQAMYKQIYGDTGQPPVGFGSGQDNTQQPQQNGNLPPVGFNGGDIDPRLKEARLAAMIGNKPLSESDMAIYNADPAVIQQKKTAETRGADIETAQKGVEGIDSRLQNAINILDDQIKLAPKTMSGSLGEFVVGAERNAANFGAKSETPTAQTLFEQNNANLFTQELPAIMQGMPGSRMDIPLINAIKQASAININGTVQEKIQAAQNLKTLLKKYQQNTHNYAAGLGGGNKPIPATSDVNPQVGFPQVQSSDSGAQEPQSQRLHVMIPDGKGGFQTGTIDASHQDTLPPGAQIIQ